MWLYHILMNNHQWLFRLKPLMMLSISWKYKSLFYWIMNHGINILALMVIFKTKYKLTFYIAHTCYYVLEVIFSHSFIIQFSSLFHSSQSRKFLYEKSGTKLPISLTKHFFQKSFSDCSRIESHSFNLPVLLPFSLSLFPSLSPFYLSLTSKTLSF